MDIENYIDEAIFAEKENHLVFYRLIWDNFKEDGFVVTDEPGQEIDAVMKATALKNLVGEFIYRLYDEVNETGFENVIEYLANLGINEEEILEYCTKIPEIDVSEKDFELSVKNAFDYATEACADKMLEEFSAHDLFDYLFTATYDFEQDFIFDFEDTDEFTAFADSNTEQLDQYKEEYPALMSWIEGGMIC